MQLTFEQIITDIPIGTEPVTTRSNVLPKPSTTTTTTITPFITTQQTLSIYTTVLPSVYNISGYMLVGNAISDDVDEEDIKNKIDNNGNAYYNVKIIKIIPGLISFLFYF